MNIPVLTQCTNTTYVSLFYFFSTVEFQFGTEVFLLSAGLSPYIILILDRNIKHNKVRYVPHQGSQDLQQLMSWYVLLWSSCCSTQWRVNYIRPFLDLHRSYGLLVGLLTSSDISKYYLCIISTLWLQTWISLLHFPFERIPININGYVFLIM